MLYVIIALVLFLLGLLLLGRLKKKYPDLYKEKERAQVIGTLLLVSIAWLVTIPIGLVAAAGYLLLAFSLKLLERFEK